MPTAKPTLTSKQFDALTPTLVKRLTLELERELRDCALPGLSANPASDLWELPTVDSKTVCKLSPVMKEIIGRRLEPSWVRKGGYQSIEAAVEDVIARAKKDCIADHAPAPTPKSPQSVTT
jgi:hypothetical protein